MAQPECCPILACSPPNKEALWLWIQSPSSSQDVREIMFFFSEYNMNGPQLSSRRIPCSLRHLSESIQSSAPTLLSAFRSSCFQLETVSYTLVTAVTGFSHTNLHLPTNQFLSPKNHVVCLPHSSAPIFCYFSPCFEHSTLKKAT